MALAEEPLAPTGGSCATSFDCSTAAAPVCAGGACVAGPAECVGDDDADLGTGDDGPAAATALDATPAAAAICNQPATESDFYVVTLAESGAWLELSLSWDGTADLDLRVYDAAGRLYGQSLHRHPEDVDLRRLAAGDYFVAVRRRAATQISAAVPYTLTATPTFLASFCKVDSDCQGLWTSTALYRSVCSGLGCAFRSTSGLAAGAACDSDANCASGHCSYTAFQSDVGASVCTETCSSDADCAAVAGAPICSSGRAPNLCLPACALDTECGADPATKPPDAGLPWAYCGCAVAAERCSAWIFKDGFEGGDEGLW